MSVKSIGSIVIQLKLTGTDALFVQLQLPSATVTKMLSAMDLAIKKAARANSFLLSTYLLSGIAAT